GAVPNITYQDLADCDYPDVVESWETNTITEWKVQDMNGDGFPDVVASAAPVLECERDNDPAESGGPGCTKPPYDVQPEVGQFYACISVYHEDLGVGACPSGWTPKVTPKNDGAATFLNVAGAIAPGFYQSTFVERQGSIGVTIADWKNSDVIIGTNEVK